MKFKVESGVPGVYWDKSHNSWRVGIERDGKTVYLGRRKTLEEAEKLRRDAEVGRFPTEEEKLDRLFDKMARVRMRAVWREATKEEHGWKSFDDFLISVGDRPETERKLVARDETRPIGPDNFQWVKPRFDYKNREDRIAYNKIHRKENPDVYRDREFRKRFGISLEEVKKKIEEQGGVCAICHQPEKASRNGVVRWLNVDHNHTTLKVRGMLCTNCNVAVGMLYENRELIKAVIEYLDKWDAIEAQTKTNEDG